MKKFFSEFKTFITRGNVLDMAVGVIVGGAFTAIVNGLSNFILKPIINWLLALVFGANSLSEVYTMLKEVKLEDGTVDLTQSIYIDWGSFVNAIINFLLIAFVLFTIVKAINTIKAGNEAIASSKPTKEDKIEMKAQGIKLHDRDAVKVFLDAKAQVKAEAEAQAAKAAEEQAKLDRLANPTTEDLLKKICELLESK